MHVLAFWRTTSSGYILRAKWALHEFDDERYFLFLSEDPQSTLNFPCKVPAKRSQHANATCRNIVGRNMLRAFGHRAATCWVSLTQICPFSNLSQQHPTGRNTSQHGGQMHTTCCAQQCCDMLRWHVGVGAQDNNKNYVQFNKLTSVFYASVLLLIMNFVITLSK